MSERTPIVILLAEDDEEDAQMTLEALKKNRLGNDVRVARDGEQVMDYLRREGRFGNGADAPTPGLILLDLNMPRKDGREALAEIKSNDALRKIPVIVLTTSKAEEDIFRSYDLGVNSFVTKPVTFAGLAESMKVLSQYWFEIVELPAR
ncbi:MAG TPA: response regulator, partial [Gaiellaceae bacterium]|nr:response regulator [Gaiellaceae bacterium]